MSHLSQGLVGVSAMNARAVFDVIDDIGQLGLAATIPIPRIVVVGDQSSGKSSVLQAIANIELPQGTGTVTRCPLVLRMQQTRPSDQQSTTITVAWDGCTPRQIDENTIVEEIREATKILTGNDEMCFSDVEIQLTIKGPKCSDLTLVDLPGIVRHVRDGQDPKVKDLVRNMIRAQIQKEESIIAAVVACGDLETSEALSLAQEYDPQRQRTIGILTKPDLQDRGTSMSKALLGQEHYLKHGYAVLKNRGQSEIEAGQTWAEAREDEQAYFESHEVYGTMARELFGASHLIKRLQPLLRASILQHLPGIRAKVKASLEESERELTSIGPGPPSAALEQIFLAARLLDRVKARMSSLLYEESGGSGGGDSDAAAAPPPSVQLRRAYEAFDLAARRALSPHRRALAGGGGRATGPIFVEFAMASPAAWVTVDHSFVVSKVLPCAGVDEAEARAAVRVTGISKARDAGATVLEVSGCTKKGLNATYEEQVNQMNLGEKVFKSTTSNCWLFLGSDMCWSIGSDSSLASGFARGTAEPSCFSDPCRCSDWELWDSDNQRYAPCPGMKVEEVKAAWRVEFAIAAPSPAPVDPVARSDGAKGGAGGGSGDGPGPGEADGDFEAQDLTARVTGHLSSHHAAAAFARQGLRLLRASPLPPACFTRDVRRLLEASRGPQPPGFVSSAPFRTLVREAVDGLRGPAAGLVDAVAGVARGCAEAAVSEELRAWPGLQAEARVAAAEVVGQLEAAARGAAEGEVDKEWRHLFTNNKYFANTVGHLREERRARLRRMLGADADAGAAGEGGGGAAHGGSNAEEEAQDVEDKVVAYCKVVYKRAADSVPAAAHCAMVLPLAQSVHAALEARVGSAAARGRLAACLAEGGAAGGRRDALRRRVERLREAGKILEGVVEAVG